MPGAYINLVRGDGPQELTNGPGDSFPLLDVEPRYDLINRLLIAGPSGAGKSTIAGKWLESQGADRERDIFLLSRVTEDGALDDLPLLQRLELDSDFAEAEPLTAEDFKDATVLFDDTDTIADKKVRAAVNALRDDLLETGRHQGVQSITITHQLFQGNASKKPLSEATGVVLFPQAGSKYHFKRYLREYAGFETAAIKKIMAVNSRWVYIQRTHPAYVVYERGAFLV